MEILLCVTITASLGLYIANVVGHSKRFDLHFENKDDFVGFVRDAYQCYGLAVYECLHTLCAHVNGKYIIYVIYCHFHGCYTSVCLAKTRLL